MRYQQDESDASRSWSARERVIIRSMDIYPGTSENALVVVMLETFLLESSNVVGTIIALAVNAWDGDRRWKQEV